MRKSFFISGLIILLNIFSPAAANNLSAQEFGYQPFRECWKIQTPIVKDSQPASDNTNVFLPLPEGVIEAVNSQSGAIVWKTEIGGEIDGKIVIDKNNLYVISRTNGGNSSDEDESESNISSISAGTGIVQWRTKIGAGSGLGSPKVFIRNSAPLIIISEGKVDLLDPQNGLPVKNFKLNFSPAAAVLVSENSVYLSDSTGRKIFKIDLTDLKTNAQPAETEIFSTDDEVTSMIHVGEDLYVGDKLGKVYKISNGNSSNRRADWTSRVGAGITNIAKYKDRLLISSADNYVYLISKNNGNRLWKKRLRGSVRGEPLIIGDLGVLTPNGENVAEFVEMKKGKTINQLQLKADTEANTGNENFFLNSPSALPNDIILFPTVRGYTAFSSPGCGSIKLKAK